MSQSLSHVTVHIVFSTKDHRPFLQNPDIRAEMHKQLGGTSKTLTCPPIVVGGIEDHVHILARQSKTISLAEWIKELKRVTSIWIKDRDPSLKRFAWQAGYGAFSVSQSEVNRVVDYIRNQEEHHRRFDFKAEFRKLLERYEIEFDERYVWD